MFSRIRKRFTYANLALTLALVFVMSGGALAASKYLITSTKQISPKVLKSLKGASGKNGANGPAGAIGPGGPAGPAGSAGGLGPEGKEGKAGTNGKNGTNGKSVTVTTESKGAHCEEGGSSFEQEGSGTKAYACNGSPWTAGGTLPSKATEKGTWAILGTAANAGESFVYSISLPIPLKAPIKEANIGYFGFFSPTPTESTECPGGFTNPGAIPGQFCIYAKEVTNLTLEKIEDVQIPGTTSELEIGETGAMIGLTSTAAGPVVARGTWAVTEK